MIPGPPLLPVLVPLAQEASHRIAPLPAQPPIEGPLWTVVIPAILLLGSFLGTYMLYKRFAQEEER